MGTACPHMLDRQLSVLPAIGTQASARTLTSVLLRRVEQQAIARRTVYKPTLPTTNLHRPPWSYQVRLYIALPGIAVIAF